MLLDFRVLPFQSNVGYDVILSIDTLMKHQLLWTTFRHRFVTQPEPATPRDLLAAHISAVEAYVVEGDVREVNIPTFEPDLLTSFDDPVPWDVMPTGISDIPTQIYGLADFQSAIGQFCRDFADIFCREVKSKPARVEPLKVEIDWDKWRIPKNGGPPRPQSMEKMEETRSQIERMLELDLIEPSKSPYYSHVHLVRKPTGKWRFCIDFRTINDLCGNIGWPIPNIAQTLNRIGKT
jgi:hypothetical protein